MTDAKKPNGKGKTIKFELDGKTVEAGADETIWQVANRLGTEIPHLCYSPEPGYRADGNCRACMVEIEGERVLAASCIRKPSEGMKVKSASERAKASRKMVFELLVADQPARETAPDPQSKFWAWTDKMGIATSRFPEDIGYAPDRSHTHGRDGYQPIHDQPRAEPRQRQQEHHHRQGVRPVQLRP